MSAYYFRFLITSGWEYAYFTIFVDLIFIGLAQGSSINIGKMDCGPFFCPNVEMVAVTVPPEGHNDSSTSQETSLDYCCYTIPSEGTVDMSMPYCCDYEEYSENSYTMAGLGPTSRLLVAFLPAAIALFLATIGVAYIMFIICCRLEPERGPVRGGRTVHL
ncbi:hypothetical protein RvY_00661-2 [Ramazzottius varieornatus]|uniref:Uncharacterized protein n=1 Tax=Ramazzottius varieornatus TaxID=947166 RepID=A0A1D1UH74_RAMVA|nr:hypothetical protein RvY_00661-2 [Ramazzottius varieornatus]